MDAVLGGTYRVVRKIGAGGMADVYEVEHVRLGARFAAKVARTLSRDEATHRRFFREARMLASLKSDHVVVVFDVSGPEVDPPFMIMELLNGQDLRQLLRDVPKLSIGRATKLVSDACLGLIAVHAAGVIHRDLKPENLFVTHRDDGEEYCKLLDFGVGKAEQGTSTQHGGLIGTIKYMAPEQIEHAGLVTAQSDVRSVAAILYECLAGRPPFEAPTVEQLLFRVLNERPEPIRALRAEVPAELDAIVMRALARDPSLRFPSARALADALRPFAHLSFDLDATQRDEATSIDVRVPALARAARRRFVRALGIASFAGASAIAIAFGASLHRAPKPEPAELHVATNPLRTEPPVTSRTPVPGSPSRPSDAAATASSTATAVATPAQAGSSAARSTHSPTGSSSVASALGGTVHHAAPVAPASSVPRAAKDAGAATVPPRANDSILRIDSKSPYEN
jgi:serine/threonine-protein kinase